MIGRTVGWRLRSRGVVLVLGTARPVTATLLNLFIVPSHCLRFGRPRSRASSSRRDPSDTVTSRTGSATASSFRWGRPRARYATTERDR